MTVSLLQALAFTNSSPWGEKQNTYSDITHIHYENNLKVKITKTESNPHLLDLLCKGNQIHGVSNSVGLVGTNQFQPTGSTAALNQSHCKKINKNEKLNSKLFLKYDGAFMAHLKIC